MPRIAEWTFEEKPGSQKAVDSETGDGTAQNGMYVNGATPNGTGAAVFDGRDDYVEIPYDPAFDLKTGSIAITFTQDTASISDNPWDGNAAQTLFSRDSSGFDGGGHLTIFIKSDGTVAVRHQDSNSSYNFEGGTVTLGQPATMIYSWGPDGSQLIVDGVVVDKGDKALNLIGNKEPITIGASQAQSGDGVADNLRGYFDGEIQEVSIYDEPAQNGAIPCFTKGTLIRTPDGDVAVEELRVGDLVCTMHHGPQRIRWIGARSCRLGHCAQADARQRPVRIRAGALGVGLPIRDLAVSRQHRVMVSSEIASRMFDTAQVLVAAIRLTELPGIAVDDTAREVAYVHVMFDRHQVIFAEGAPSESFYPGRQALNAVPTAARRDILAMFPELEQGSRTSEPALLVPTGRRQKDLVARHKGHGTPLLDAHDWVAKDGAAKDGAARPGRSAGARREPPVIAPVIAPVMSAGVAFTAPQVSGCGLPDSGGAMPGPPASAAVGRVGQ